ncbi:hypothetical protein ABEB36_008599 [Hypothenemus hampei]|uniref:Uncharacterized protein n=1 Tax=Hypothenemus hampei TaxID=57062 RepID=A0ABD1EME8_HYPHA
MKMHIILFAVLLHLVVDISTTPVVQENVRYKTVDQEFLDKQEKVLTLFHHIDQDSVFEEHVQIQREAHDPVQYLQTRENLFVKPDVVITFINYFRYGLMLPKGVPFSVMTQQHLDQAVAMFKLFYYAKDFRTFYTMAVIMKHFVNEGMFLYSLSLAVTHRNDTYGIILPPIYEVYPWYFYNTQVIHQAQTHKMHENNMVKNNAHNHHYVYVNTTGSNLNPHWEHTFNYFTEDVGTNSFWYYFNLHYPSWMDGEEFHIKNDYRGELYLTAIRSLAARFYLERLSHGKGQISTFDWEVPFETPYYPQLMYPNGDYFPERPSSVHLNNYYKYHGEHVNSIYAYSDIFVQDFERRMRDVIDSGVVYDVKNMKHVKIYDHEHHNEIVNMFANLLQANADSANPQYLKNYTEYASHLLGYGHNHHNWSYIVPSVMEHHETALRDPAFYQLIKRILLMYHMYEQNHMVPYAQNELIFPGISIENVEMDRLITYHDDFFADITNVLGHSKDEMQVYAVQKRLNHKPFTYKIYVNSNQDVEAMVKVFIGPKYDEYGKHIDINENRWNFVLIDAFKWHLNNGQTLIKRSSQESEFYAHDKMSYHELVQKVSKAHKNQEEFHVTGKENYFYFPDRLMLPMGTYVGMPYQFYFIVYPFKPYVEQKEEMTFFYPRPGTGGGFIDDLPLYYPFDKPIQYEEMFMHEVPNSYFYETKISHRTQEEAQVPPTKHHDH